MLIRDALQAYLADRLPVVVSPYRVRHSVHLLDTMIGEREVADQVAMAAAVAHFHTARRKMGVLEATVRRDLITLKAAVRHAWKTGDAPNLFYVAVPGGSQPRQRWLTEREAQKLLAVAEGEMRTFVLLALCTGARLGALVELTWERVDLKLGVIDFRSPGSPRRKHRAIAPIAAQLREELERIRPQRPGRRRRVLALTAGTYRRKLHRLARKARIKPCTPHALRHTVATWLLAGGRTELITASRLLGHKSVSTTEQIYTHLLPQHLQDAADVLGTALITPLARRPKIKHKSGTG